MPEPSRFAWDNSNDHYQLYFALFKLPRLSLNRSYKIQWNCILETRILLYIVSLCQYHRNWCNPIWIGCSGILKEIWNFMKHIKTPILVCSGKRLKNPLWLTVSLLQWVIGVIQRAYVTGWVCGQSGLNDLQQWLRKLTHIA